MLNNIHEQQKQQFILKNLLIDCNLDGIESLVRVLGMITV